MFLVELLDVVYIDQRRKPLHFFSAGPKPAGEVSVAALTDNSVTVSWTASDDKVDSYTVQLHADNGTSITVIVDGDTITVKITGLKDRTKYVVKVVAVKDGVNSTASPDFSFTTLSDGKKMNVFYLSSIVYFVHFTLKTMHD